MRWILFLGLLAAVGAGALRLLRTGQGTLTRTAQRAADIMRRPGSPVSEQVAQKIEEVGEAADRGAERVREMVSKTEEEPMSEAPESEEERSGQQYEGPPPGQE